MPQVGVQFPCSQPDAGTYRLLELPPDLCKLVESSLDTYTPLNLTIKGSTDDDAVLCTAEKTYNIRSVVLSNSVLVIAPVGSEDAGEAGDSNVSIQESLHEILELVPAVPKLHRLTGLLRGLEWDDGNEVEVEEDHDQRRRRYTYAQAQSELQASEHELARAIKDKHILILNNLLRPISPTYLHTILELLLAQLVSLSQPHHAASVPELTSALEQDHEVRREVSMQVMRWFGEVVEGGGGLWRMDVGAVVRQVGLGILRHHKEEPIVEDIFIKKWQDAVGDTFSSSVSLDLLSGNYLTALSGRLTYFPLSELPTDPAARFTDLFITRARWRAEDVTPFLIDIAVDAKDREKLLLKYARAVTDNEGVWYTARTR
ncbi:hypothetical protein FA95DRAFT_1485775 [Auriscalpium vulgare]|uniref:Uncharacterized protein n=1 Tax=Auriscalpium vulgare TaxID=40419 RepID=A0ACB8S616_9AGAM|nr:hypothetical protein FA95DRAFT_1485775 [Auriscalpium vulgare]